MTNILAKYSREELERKLLHMTSFIAYQLATQYIQMTEKEAAVIRTPEAEAENSQRIKDHIVCVFPAWDVIELTHPGYDIMKEWVAANHKETLVKPCVCDGCKEDTVEDKLAH